MQHYNLPKAITFVWWLDAYCEPNDYDPKHKDKKPHLTLTFGVEVQEKEDDNYIYIAHNQDGICGGFDTWHAIPKGMVKHKEVVPIPQRKKNAKKSPKRKVSNGANADSDSVRRVSKRNRAR